MAKDMVEESFPQIGGRSGEKYTVTVSPVTVSPCRKPIWDMRGLVMRTNERR